MKSALSLSIKFLEFEPSSNFFEASLQFDRMAVKCGTHHGLVFLLLDVGEVALTFFCNQDSTMD